MSLITKKEKIRKAQDGIMFPVKEKSMMEANTNEDATTNNKFLLVGPSRPAKPKSYDELNFGKQFALARKEMLNGGSKTFSWRGKLYGTQLAGEKKQPSMVNTWPLPETKPENPWQQTIPKVKPPIQPIPQPHYGWNPEPINPWKQTIPQTKPQAKSDGSVEKSQRSVNPYAAEDASMPQRISPYPLPGWFSPEMKNPWINTQPKKKPQQKKESTSEKIAKKQEFKNQKNKK